MRFRHAVGFGTITGTNKPIDSTLAASALRPFDRLPRLPWILAPPLRVAADTTAPALTLHTTQTCDAYETL